MFDDRLEIIAGEAEILPEKALKIIYDFPPSKVYRFSVCGCACEIELCAF